jgi:hypothetical protein
VTASPPDDTVRVGRLLLLLVLAVLACFLLARTLGPARIEMLPPSAGAFASAAPGDAPAAPVRPHASLAAAVHAAPRVATAPVSIVSDGEAVRPLTPAAAAHRDPWSGRLPTAGLSGVDALGRREVRYDNGVTASSRVDPLGGVSTRYSNGITAESRTDLLGSTTTRFSNGVTASSRVDALGHVETRFSDGTSATTRVDALGHRVTTYSDGRTETLRPDPLSPPPKRADARR